MNIMYKIYKFIKIIIGKINFLIRGDMFYMYIKYILYVKVFIKVLKYLIY